MQLARLDSRLAWVGSIKQAGRQARMLVRARALHQPYVLRWYLGNHWFRICRHEIMPLFPQAAALPPAVSRRTQFSFLYIAMF